MRLNRVEKEGRAFLAYWRPDGELAVRVLDAADGPVVLGRRSTLGLCIDWDGSVSRTHALIEPTGEDWVLSDNGSTNGSFVDGRRVVSRTRLVDRQRIRVGHTELWFRRPGSTGGPDTVHSDAVAIADRVTPSQLRVLRVLCAPSLAQGELATPPTNQELAAELCLSVDAIKGHLRELFRIFEIGEVPQNRKRLMLVNLAMRSGAVP